MTKVLNQLPGVPLAIHRRIRSVRNRAFTLVELLVVIAIIGVLVAMLLPAINSAREAARRMNCKNNLKQIGLALNAFQETNGAFPSAVMDDTGGSTQLHTWCVQLLPFVEESALYSRYDFAAGINATVNQPVTSKLLPTYLCPSSDGKYYEGDGTFARGDYAAVSGTQPIDNGGAMYPKSKVQIKKIRDGLSTTFLVGELYYHNLGWARGSAAGTTGGSGGNGGGGGNSGAAYSRGVARWWSCNSPCAVPGLNPEKTMCNNYCEQRFQFSSAHPSGVTFVYCDGHVDFIDESIHANALRALTTIAGGELTN